VPSRKLRIALAFKIEGGFEAEEYTHNQQDSNPAPTTEIGRWIRAAEEHQAGSHTMKKGKIAFWIVIFGFVGLIIYQNKLFFMSKSHLIFSLGFISYETPNLANAIFFVAVLLMGILLTYLLSLFRQFKDAKIIKTLKAKESTLVETVSALEKELYAARDSGAAVSEAAADDEPVNMAAEAK
jgi:hypothetical protein